MLFILRKSKLGKKTGNKAINKKNRFIFKKQLFHGFCMENISAKNFEIASGRPEESFEATFLEAPPVSVTFHLVLI